MRAKVIPGGLVFSSTNSLNIYIVKLLFNGMDRNLRNKRNRYTMDMLEVPSICTFK